MRGNIIGLIILCVMFIIASLLTIAMNNTNVDYRYRSCIETAVNYSKIDVNTAQTNCQKVWK